MNRTTPIPMFQLCFALLLAVSSKWASADEEQAIGSTTEVTRIAIGRVIDTRGEPVAGASVICFDGAFPNRHEAETITDELGKFRLQYKDRPHLYLNDWLWVYSQQHSIRCVSQLERQQHEIVLPDMQEVEYTVVDPDGQALPQAVIEPYYFESPNGVYSSDVPTGLSNVPPASLTARLAVTTNADGQATLRGVPPMLLSRVKIRHSGRYGNQLLQPQPRLQLSPVGSVLIRIPKADMATLPICSATTSSNGVRVAIAEGSFNDEGECHLALADGELDIFFAANGQAELQPFVPSGLAVVAGMQTLVQIEMRQTIPIQGGILAGGRGVSGAQISVRSSGMQRIVATTDADGSFSTRVFPGEVSLQVFALDAETQKKFKYPASQTVKIAANLRSLTVDDFVLPEQKFVSGIVIDASGKPVPHRFVAAVQTKPFGFPAFADWTDEHGKFKAVLHDERWQPTEAELLLFRDQKAFRKNRDKSVELKVVDNDPLTLQVVGELPQE
ncbi:MAG: hypothetical protein R3C53_10155 [Pirellulaceae bacterium]